MRQSPLRAHRRLASTLAVVLISAVLVFAQAVFPGSVAADHEDAHLVSVDVPKRFLGIPTGEVDHEVITRNVVLGNALKVCSKDYPLATQEAISWWNDAFGIKLFEWEGTDLGKCPVNDDENDAHEGVGSVIIYDWTKDASRLKCKDAEACFKTDADDKYQRYSEQWNTLYGQMVITVDGAKYSSDYNPATTADCDAAGYESSFRKINADAAKSPPVTTAPTAGHECHELVSVLAHELGHALSLGDEYDIVACYDPVGRPATVATDLKSLMCQPRYLDGVQAHDRDNYLKAYYPDAVDDVSTKDVEDGTFTIEWDATELHSEQGVQVLWRPASSTSTQACSSDSSFWYAGAVVRAGAESGTYVYDGKTGSVSVRISTPRGGDREYAVVAFTDAVVPDPADWATQYPGWSGGGTVRLCPNHPPNDSLADPRETADEYAHAYGLLESSGGGDDSVAELSGDDGTPPPIAKLTATIAPGASPIAEGVAATFTVSLDAVATAQLTVKVSVSESGAMIAGNPPGSVTIAAGASSGTLSVPTSNDRTVEANSVVTARIAAGSGYTVGSAKSATVTVNDNDCSLTVAAGSGGTAQIEEDGVGPIGASWSGTCGTTVTARAVPSAHYSFSGWSGSVSGAKNPERVTVSRPRMTARASFTREHCTLTVTAGTGGTASGNWSGPCGTTRTITATPGNSTFGGWSGDVSGSSTSMTFEVTQNTSARANFSCTLTVTAGTGGTASGGGTGACGRSATITATPSNSAFGGWSGDVSGSSKSKTFNVNEHTSARAAFSCMLTVTAGTGGMASGGGTGACGRSATITATPSNSAFGGWSGDVSGSSRSKTFRVNEHTSARASFSCTLTVTAGTGGTASGGGTGACGRSATITATPSNSAFGGWSGDVSGSSRSKTFRVNEHTSARASFSCTLTVTAGTGGTAGGGGTVPCSASTWRTVTASEQAGYDFSHWSGDCSGSGTCRVRMNRNRSVTAHFVAEPTPQCTVVAVASKGGMVSGGGTVDCGTAVTLRATAKAGHCFSYWNQLIAPGDFAQATEATSSVCLTSGTHNVTTNSGTRNQIYQAVFRAKRSYTLTVVGGSGGGSYLEGTWATASAPAGKCFLGTAYIFKRWSGDSTSTSRTIRIYMSRNMSVTATFTVAGTCPFAQAAEGETAPHVADDP